MGPKFWAGLFEERRTTFYPSRLEPLTVQHAASGYSGPVCVTDSLTILIFEIKVTDQWLAYYLIGHGQIESYGTLQVTTCPKNKFTGQDPNNEIRYSYVQSNCCHSL
jgi:hypothetical protein